MFQLYLYELFVWGSMGYLYKNLPYNQQLTVDIYALGIRYFNSSYSQQDDWLH